MVVDDLARARSMVASESPATISDGLDMQTAAREEIIDLYEEHVVGSSRQPLLMREEVADESDVPDEYMDLLGGVAEEVRASIISDGQTQRLLTSGVFWPPEANRLLMEQSEKIIATQAIGDRDREQVDWGFISDIIEERGGVYTGYADLPLFQCVYKLAIRSGYSDNAHRIPTPVFDFLQSPGKHVAIAPDINVNIANGIARALDQPDYDLLEEISFSDEYRERLKFLLPALWEVDEMKAADLSAEVLNKIGDEESAEEWWDVLDQLMDLIGLMNATEGGSYAVHEWYLHDLDRYGRPEEVSADALERFLEQLDTDVVPNCEMSVDKGDSYPLHIEGEGIPPSTS